MLKTMLADRMQLVAHYEMRERPVYELVLASSDGRLGHAQLPVVVIDSIERPTPN